MSTNQVLKYINETNCNKSSGEDIPTKNSKMAKKRLTVPVTNCTNECISLSTFPNELKIADIIPVYKKRAVNNKTNYRSISLLPIISI